LDQQARNFPTPNTSPSAPNGGLNRGNGQLRARTTDQCLERMAQNFPTPNVAQSIQGSNPRIAGDKRGGLLVDAARELWATPQAHDSTGKRGEGFSASDHHYHPHDLPSQVDNWATPEAANTRSGEVSMTTHGKNSRPLQEQVSLFFHQDGTTGKLGLESGKSAPTSGPQLNPRFCEWLMGLPIGWTLAGSNFDAREMQSFLSRQRSHLQLLLSRQLEAGGAV